MARYPHHYNAAGASGVAKAQMDPYAECPLIRLPRVTPYSGAICLKFQLKPTGQKRLFKN